MSNTTKTHNSFKVIGTPYDNVFKTLLIDCSGLIIPVINEIFNENHNIHEKIIFSRDEYFQVRQNGQEDKKITDSCFNIESKPDTKYHLECQSTADGSILIRMFEYDTQIALNDSKLDTINYTLTVNFPQSAVLYLRHTKNTPENMRTIIKTPNGDITYNIPVLRVQKYEIDEIFSKNLFILIPFYIFSYESKFDNIESDEEHLKNVQDTYKSIMVRIEEVCLQGEITEYEKQTIIDMSKEVLRNIAAKYSNVQKGVGDIMGGYVLDYEAKRIKREGIEDGMQRINELNVKLAKLGRNEDIIKAASDAEYQRKLMEELGI